jgi:hypothetical protein
MQGLLMRREGGEGVLVMAWSDGIRCRLQSGVVLVSS